MVSSAYSYRKVDGFDVEDDSKTTTHAQLENEIQNRLGWKRKPSVFWLLPSFLLFNLTMGATAMPKMNILISLICRNVLSQMSQSATAGSMQQTRSPHEAAGESGHSLQSGSGMGNFSVSAVVIGDHNPQCSIKEVESATALLNLYGNLIAGIIGALCAPLWGKLSDRYGRVKPLTAASIVVVLSELVGVLIAAAPDVFSLNWIYVGYLLEGLSGTFILIMALASSYAADCTEDSERNVALGWFHGVMFFGMAVGPIFGGYLGMIGGKSRPLLIFYTALILRIIGVVFLFLVPESLAKSDMRRTQSLVRDDSNQTWASRLKGANPLHALRILIPSKSKVGKPSQRNLIALAGVNTVMFGGFMGAMNVMMLYSQYTFGWGNKESGIFLSIVNFFRTIATIVVLPLAIRLFRRWLSPTGNGAGLRGFDSLDLFLIRISIASDVIGYIGYAIAPTGALFTLSGAVASLGAVGLATSEASMTKLIPKSQTGELLGALGFLQAMARILAPTVANLTYSWTVDRVPQLVFWGIAIVFVAAGGVSFLARPQAVSAEMLEDDGEGEESEAMVPIGGAKQCANC
ncbi:Hippocampus abundant transcript 1 protein [Pseudocyphellaria aurata]|nr:Hippocampus abundant transcript 1 protein [Pseudocyphellaria aurata]